MRGETTVHCDGPGVGWEYDGYIPEGAAAEHGCRSEATVSEGSAEWQTWVHTMVGTDLCPPCQRRRTP